jgi:hypothetical protein
MELAHSDRSGQLPGIAHWTGQLGNCPVSKSKWANRHCPVSKSKWAPLCVPHLTSHQLQFKCRPRPPVPVRHQSARQLHMYLRGTGGLAEVQAKGAAVGPCAFALVA